MRISKTGAIIALFLTLIMPLYGQLRVYTIGDSTVQDYVEGTYYPRKGWGQMLPYFFDTGNVTFTNKAVGGSSSKSFYNTYWSDVKSTLQSGDILFIQFGINDRNSSDAARYAPTDTFNSYITKFVTEARAIGAIPVLVTTVRRNAWNADGTCYDSYHEHPQLMRDLSTSLSTPLVDLDAWCKELFEAQGQTYVTRHLTMTIDSSDFTHSNKTEGYAVEAYSLNADAVHYQETGATDMARKVVETVESSDNATLQGLAQYTLTRRNVTFAVNDTSKDSTISRTATFPQGCNVTLRTLSKNGANFLYWLDDAGNQLTTNNYWVVTMGKVTTAYKAIYDGERHVTGSIKVEDNQLTAPEEGISYKWYKNGTIIDGETDQVLKNPETGTYTVELINGRGQVITSYQVSVAKDEEGKVYKVHIIGDSTVMTYGSSYYPWCGWGQEIPYFFDSKVTFENHAIGGRSSKSFRAEGRWQTVLDELNSGDYVFIQFGHNDRDWSKPARYCPIDSFKMNIDSFVTETRAKGAIPVLVSPMVLNAWRNNVLRNVFDESGAEYRDAMKEVADNRGVAFVDLNQISWNEFSTSNYEYLSRYYYNTYVAGEYANYADGNTDYTHFQEMGALTMARMISQELKAINNNETNVLVNHQTPLYTVTFKANVTQPGWLTTTADFPAGCTITAKCMPSKGTYANYWHWWNQDGQDLSDTDTMVSFTMPAYATTLTALFKGGDEATTYTDTAKIVKHGSGSSYQTIAQGEAIADFQFEGQNCNSLSVEGLPNGLTASWDNTTKYLSITGTANDAPGEYVYTITTIGGLVNVSRTGAITLTDTTETNIQNIYANASCYLEVYPNPVQENMATVYLYTGKPTKGYLLWYDVEGKLLMSRNVDLKSGSNEIYLPKPHTQKMGIVKVIIGGKTIEKKILFE